MKITLISNLYEPYARGGAEIIVKRTALALLNQGHQISIITAKPWEGFKSLDPEVEEKSGLKIIRFYPFNLFFYPNDHKFPLPVRLLWHFFDLFNVQSAHLIGDILSEEKPDLVVTHNLIGLGFFLPGVIHRRKIRHIHVLHDIQLAVRTGTMKKGQEDAWFVNGFLARLYQRVVKALFGSPDVVISPSHFLLDFYQKRGYFSDSEMRVLRNPIDERFFAVESATETGQIGEKLRFACIGQLAPHKGLSTLKEAFRKFDYAGVELHLVGDGPMRREIEEWAKIDDRVIYHGRIANEELPRFLTSMDIVLVPTETYENSPTVVFESLASARPVIVSDIGGSAEPIVNGKNGLVFTPGNADDLREKMKTMAENHGSMRQAARDSVKGMGVKDYASELLKELIKTDT